jgi:hypothetical protein
MKNASHKAADPEKQGANVAVIHRLRGILKRKPGEKPFAREMAEHKRKEKALEEAKYIRSVNA